MAVPTFATTLDAARKYISQGWSVISVPYKEKNPGYLGWQNQRLRDPDLAAHFVEPCNAGALCGEPSNGLTDIDLDCVEALGAADIFLPHTPMVHGRTSSRSSHRWYIATPVLKTKPYEDVDGSKLLEVRSTGAHTLVPPSTHPSGEVLAWEGPLDPRTIAAEALLRAAGETAVCALMARHWPAQGSRHRIALAWAGFLLRGGVPEDRVELLIEHAAKIADDDEWPDRRAAVASTKDRIADGQAATGAPSLIDIVGAAGEKVVRKASDWLGLTHGRVGNVSTNKPALDAGNVDLETATPLALNALDERNKPPFLFLYGDAPVRLTQTSGQAPRLQPVGPLALRHELARAAEWYRTTKAGREPALPPPHIVSDILGAPEIPWPRVRRLTAIPAFTRHGSLLIKPGYDAVSELYYAPGGSLSLPVPAMPSPDQIAAAVGLLRDDLLRDFPFAEESDRANTLGAFVLGFIRDLIDGPTPLNLIEKPAPGTGASLLVEVISGVLTGRAAPVMTQAWGDEEFRKRITAGLIESPDIFLIDNVRGTLQSGALAAALTSTLWRDRLMGLSRIVDIPVHCTWVATANNPVLSDEIARRSVRIRLDAKEDRPWQRTGFLHSDLRGFVASNRGRLVTALLTLCQAWIAAGRPRGATILGMFEGWSEVVGGILDVAGVKGFLQNSASLYERADIDGQEVRALFDRWRARFGAHPVSVADIFPLVNPADGDPLELGLGDGNDRSQRTKLGKKLNHIRDRRYGSYAMVNAGTRQGAQLWVLQDQTTISPHVSARSSVDHSTGIMGDSPGARTDTGDLFSPEAHPTPGLAALLGQDTAQNAPSSSTQSTAALPAESDADAGGESRICIPLMITRRMRADLKALGYADTAIDAMAPADACRVLGILGVSNGAGAV